MAHSHHTTEINERFDFSRVANVAYLLIGVGLVLALIGFFVMPDPPGRVHHGGHHDDHHSAIEAPAHTPASDIHTVADEPAGDHADDHHGSGHEKNAHDRPITKGTRLLANVLLNSMYFITLTVGALFFLTIHKVGNAGWHTAIKRIPEAISTYLPIGALFLAALCFFLPDLYDWAYGTDEIIATKEGYLNQGFFILRNAIFLAIWIGAAFWLRNLSQKEDNLTSWDSDRPTWIFSRATAIAAIYIILFALSYSLFTVDWIKSLEPHWFSTIFMVYVFAGSMQSALITMYLIVLVAKRFGYMSYVNDSHLHDLGKYTFGFSVFWGYIWVAQYLLIWYSNIPEEGAYYVTRYRVHDATYLGYASMFYLNVLVNFAIPFIGLMTRNAKRRPEVFVPIGLIVLYGHWHDLFVMIMPGAVGQFAGIGFLEIGSFLLFAGIFIAVVFRALSRANLVPSNHPYLEESLHHSTGPV
ncbi:MAG: quinol:cytochrome C oxidoreductase [Bacteroidota bacterium]